MAWQNGDRTRPVMNHAELHDEHDHWWLQTQTGVWNVNNPEKPKLVVDFAADSQLELAELLGDIADLADLVD